MTCEIVKDLIPMCVDNTASEDAIKEVREHIELCSDCRRFYHFCKNSENKLSGRVSDVLRVTSRKKTHDVDAAFADLSKKIKMRNKRQLAISIAVLFAVVTYIVVEIFKSSKHRKDK